MKKMSLDLNELRVETFVTDEGVASRGTVRGHADTDCCTISCNGTCGAFPDSDLNARALALTRPPAQCSQFCCA